MLKFLGTAIGAIEWYENAICIALTDVISRVFFPEFDTSARFMLYLLSIAIGYLGRPIGGFILGHYSDKYNRMRAAFFGFTLMVFASLAISFLPAYGQIGRYAPALFIFFRFLQGVAIGGNYGVAVASVESVHRAERYATSSLVSVGIMIGFLLGSVAATILNYFFTQDFLVQFGWRIGLWSSAIFSIPVFIAFAKTDMKKKEKVQSFVTSTVDINWKLVAKVFVLFLLDMVPFYLLFTFLPNYKIMFLGQDSSQIWFYHSVSMVVIALFTPFFGKLADAYGAIKSLKVCAIGLFVTAFFGPWNSWIWSFVFAILMAVCYGSLYGFVALIFPESVRARIAGVLFNVTGSISIGVTPLIAAYLARYNFNYVSYFLAFVVSCVWLVLNTLKEELE